MDSNLFSQINTTIAVKENSFITVDTFQKMLQVGNKDDIALLLQTTPYHLSVEELDDLTAIDASLMRELSQEYKWAFAEAPKKMIVNLFSLRYVYHNVKVLLKAKATGKDLSDLLIPIGEHSLEALQHMISALKSDFFPDFMVAEIRNIWAEYEDYKDIRVLEIGVDLAYFNHLQKIAEQSELPAFSQAATLMIDFYNVTTVQRVLRQKKLRSFMLQLLSDNGSFTADEFIDLVENNELRKEVEAALVGHMQDFVMAKSLENTLMVEEMFSVPTKEVQLFIETENVMSVTVPKMHSHIENPYGDDNGDVVYSYLAF